MANMLEIDDRTQRVLIDTLTGFRAHYEKVDAAYEIFRQPLVASHDQSIYFTNSTTSVMKNTLLSKGTIESVQFLVQPAMGSQGIDNWTKSRTFGPYASYFHSLGAIYPIDQGPFSCQDMMRLCTDNWAIEDRHLQFWLHPTDKNIAEVAREGEVDFAVAENMPVNYFRHQYGELTLLGRNANLMSIDDLGNAYIIGNLTLIEHTGKPKAWEVSFDSPTIASSRLNLEHPTDSIPIKALEAVYDPLLRRVAKDCAMIVGALTMEGLEPKSRGKNGILRKFFKTLVEIATAAEYTPVEIAEYIGAAATNELLIRDFISPQNVNTTSLEQSLIIANKWIPQLTKPGGTQIDCRQSLS